MSASEKYGRSDAELLSLPQALAPDAFKGKVVLVSGAGTGIGRACAFWFARLGAKLVVCGRKAEPLQSLKDALAPIGAEVLIQTMSIRDPDAVAALFDAAWAHYGRVDVLVNNAGGQFPQAAIDFAPKGWNAVIDTNLNGPWYMMQAAARKWRDAGLPGSIVNVVTVIDRGMPGVAHTCAARAGIVYVSKTVAIEWAPLNIRINCVAPGIISTEAMNVYPEEARNSFTSTNLMKRFGQVEDIANTVCFLAGSSGAFITGEVVTVDGGNHLWGDQWTIAKPDYFKV
ncbi:MAG: SDR family oxidoreductase [Hyphomonadaceae bacterium]|nr:SDR family oxidoreductase [Hyphomonadaceae bacterium]